MDGIIEGECGIPRKFYFMFQPSYWFPVRGKRSMMSFSIRNLSKKYSNGNVALKNLSLDFDEDQITAFLGHNAASKPPPCKRLKRVSFLIEFFLGKSLTIIIGLN